MQPCQQADNIRNINTTLDRLVALLEKVADQGARVDHLELHSIDHQKHVENLFGRVRQVELTIAAHNPEKMDALNAQLEAVCKRLDKITSFYRVITHKRAIAVYTIILAMIVFGFVSDVWNHWEWVKTVWLFWRG